MRSTPRHTSKGLARILLQSTLSPVLSRLSLADSTSRKVFY
jgi:hypothetical protein